MTSIIAIILVLGGLIFFHELGHFLAARFFGIGVTTFSLGFGPKLFAKRIGNTTYQLAAVPLGGFVSIVGETAEAELPEGFTGKENFSLRPAWQRFIVIAAGASFNLLLAWFICWGVLFARGETFMPPVVGRIVEGSPAASSPLQLGHKIIAMNGQSIERWEDIPFFMYRNKEKTVSITVERADSTTVIFTLTPAKLSQTDESGKKVENWGMGIGPKMDELVHKDLNIFTAAVSGIKRAADMVNIVWTGLGDLVSGREDPTNLGGPILIGQAIHQQTSQGIVSLLLLTAVISVNLGILNLLPIPVLDGGHLFFIILGAIIRRPIPVGIQEKAAMGGIVLLIALMLFATFNDIVRLFGGSAG